MYNLRLEPSETLVEEAVMRHLRNDSSDRCYPTDSSWAGSVLHCDGIFNISKRTIYLSTRTHTPCLCLDDPIIGTESTDDTKIALCEHQYRYIPEEDTRIQFVIPVYLKLNPV